MRTVCLHPRDCLPQSSLLLQPRLGNVSNELVRTNGSAQDLDPLRTPHIGKQICLPCSMSWSCQHATGFPRLPTSRSANWSSRESSVPHIHRRGMRTAIRRVHACLHFGQSIVVCEAAQQRHQGVSLFAPFVMMNIVLHTSPGRMGAILGGPGFRVACSTWRSDARDRKPQSHQWTGLWPLNPPRLPRELPARKGEQTSSTSLPNWRARVFATSL